MSAFFGDTFARGSDKFIQMTGSRVTVSECTLNENLRLGEVFYGPAGSKTQRIHFRRNFTHALTDQLLFFVHMLSSL